jgi:hypothetical protein
MCFRWGMRDRSRTHRPADLNKLATSIVGDAIGEPTLPDADEGKHPAAVSLGRRGKIARKAAVARWQVRDVP